MSNKLPTGLALISKISSNVENVREVVDSLGVDFCVFNTTPLGWMVQASGGNKVARDVALGLINLGANPNAKTPDGHSVLAASVWGGLEDLSISLLSSGANADDSGSCGALRPLSIACCRDFSGHAVSLLIKHGANVNGLAFEEKTPLILAADQGNAEAVNILIDSGVNLNQKSSSGKLALHSALKCGRGEIARILLSAGADAGLKESDDTDILAAASWSGSIDCAKIAADARALMVQKNPTVRYTLMDSVFDNPSAIWFLHSAGALRPGDLSRALIAAAGMGDWRSVASFLSVEAASSRIPAPETLGSILISAAQFGPGRGAENDDRGALKLACQIAIEGGGLCIGRKKKVSDQAAKLALAACSSATPEILEALSESGYKLFPEDEEDEDDCLQRLIAEWDPEDDLSTKEGAARERCLRALWNSGIDSARAAEALAQASQMDSRHSLSLLMALVEEREMDRLTTTTAASTSRSI